MEEKSRREKEEESKEEDTGARNVRKVAKHCVFPMICGSGGSKGRLLKAAGAETPHQRRTTFGSWDVQNQVKMLKN